MRSILTLLVVALCALPAPAWAGPEDARLLQIADAEHPQREAALAWWTEQSPKARLAILRRALHSDDPNLALVGASVVGYPYLDGEELRLAHGILRRRPDWFFQTPEALWPLLMGSDTDFGADDVLPYFEAAVADDTIDDRSHIERAHRCLRTEHVEGILPLLEQGNLYVFTGLLWSVQQIGEFDRQDRFRESVARGLLYGLRRMRAEREEKPRPKLADVHVQIASPEGGGLPPAYVEIAEASLPGCPDGWEMGDRNAVLSIVTPIQWLRRWALTLKPGPQDVPFLERVLEATFTEGAFHPFGPGHRLWALRALADMPDQVGKLRAWAETDDLQGLYAAAVLGERGEKAPFERLVDTIVDVGDEELLGALDPLMRLVDKDRARARLVRRILASGLGSSLEPEDRIWDRRIHGVAMTDDDLGWIEEELWKGDAPIRTLLDWYVKVRPGRLTTEGARRLSERLTGMGRLDWEYRSLDTLDPLLAELQLVAPEATRAMLVRWIETQPGARDETLLRLARLGAVGEAAIESAMLESWPRWEDEARWALGRVCDPLSFEPSPRVSAFLWRQAEGGDGELTTSAFEALLVQAGLHPRTCALVREWARSMDEPITVEDPTFRKALEILRSGDAVGALLVVAEQADHPLNALGRVRDERVLAHLRKLRQARHEGLYWDATAALALAGDPAARSEYVGLMADDRTWILDGLQESGLRSERSVTAMLLERLDTNCCLGWAAHTLLKVIYPSLPFDDGYGGVGTVDTGRWLDRYAWKRSPLVEGWVPVRK